MKVSDSWFAGKSTQGMVLGGVSSLPVWVAVGPNTNSEPIKNTDENGNRFFEAGVSEVGGDEVVG